MSRNTSERKAPQSSLRRFISILLVCVFLVGAAALPAVWLLMEPVCVVQGMVRIVPVVRSVIDDTPQPDETANYEQFVNTQALLLMSDSQRLQKVVDDLAGRNLEFLSGKPCTRIERLAARIAPREKIPLPDEALKKAIAEQRITAGYVPNSELMAVSMRGGNVDEAKVIVNSLLRNYVGQYGVDATTSESQNITILENQRNEIQRRLLETRTRIRDLTNEYGTTALDPLREMEMNRQRLLQEELPRIELQKIKLQADIGMYEKTEKLEMTPEQVVEARTAHINSDPLVEKLSSTIVQMELDLITAPQTNPPANPTDTRTDAALKALKQKLEERRLALADEFDGGLESRLKDAARQRATQAKAEKTRIEAHIDEIRRALGDQAVKTVRRGNPNLDIQDLQRKLKMDEEVLDQVNRRLCSFEMGRDRRPRVQIASLAEVKETVDNRRRWTFIILGAVVLISVLLRIMRRLAKPRFPSSNAA
jgi:uncharacterized protein involved in exopolysaccharide biosynthesis